MGKVYLAVNAKYIYPVGLIVMAILPKAKTPGPKNIENINVIINKFRSSENVLKVESRKSVLKPEDIYVIFLSARLKCKF